MGTQQLSAEQASGILGGLWTAAGLLILLVCSYLGWRVRRRCRCPNDGVGRLRSELEAAGVKEGALDTCLARLAAEGIGTWQHLVAVQPTLEELEHRFGLKRGHAAVLGVALTVALVGKPAPLWKSGGAAAPPPSRAPCLPTEHEGSTSAAAAPRSPTDTEMVVRM